MPNTDLEALLREEAAHDPEPLTAEQIAQALGSRSLTGCRPSAREEIEMTLKIERILARASAHVRPPNRKEIDTFYKLNRSRFWLPETARVSQIVKNVTETFPREEALSAMRRAQEELVAGAAFEQVAERFSDCPANAGDSGWFARGDMVEEFDEQVFSLAEGQTSEIFETRFGFHIARLTGRRADGIQPLSFVRESISAHLYEQRKRRALDEYLQSLVSKSKSNGNESLLRSE